MIVRPTQYQIDLQESELVILSQALSNSLARKYYGKEYLQKVTWLKQRMDMWLRLDC